MITALMTSIDQSGPALIFGASAIAWLSIEIACAFAIRRNERARNNRGRE
ncbi:hypothetical protein [Kaistia granuli]|nr:hypothetical protein [Kaistia granuli]